ncbi:glycosyltransferase [Parabacteroides chongii]|uniref:glycosyltransferase n=1 Tax=Parabacteroides chongii TaxID=2685834 RepID=UPI00240E9565|nr:glycosyltransferase [Parabacteroides chongii]WFE83090.1 glycosyltransferase [Parabacteroides chongii]
MKPKVSVILPIYKVEKYLNRCMYSLLNQTLKDIEIIMVDDGSPDNSPAMCDQYAKEDSRVKVIHKQNAGLGFARNSGLEIATGDYIAFVDSDDFVSVTAFEILLKVALEENADYVMCGYKSVRNDICVSEHKDVDQKMVMEAPDCYNVLRGMIGIDPDSEYSYRHNYSVWHGIYKNTLFTEGGIRFCSERDLISEDLIFHLSLIPLCRKIVIIPDLLYNYCLNDNSLTTTYRKDRFGDVLKLWKASMEMVASSSLENMDTFLDYLLLKVTLDTVSFEVRYNKSDALCALKRISANKEVQERLRIYPIHRLCRKHYFFFLLLEKKAYRTLYWLFKIKIFGEKCKALFMHVSE